MQMTTTSRDHRQISSACAIIPLFERQRSALTRLLDTPQQNKVEKIIKQTGFSGQFEKTLTVHTPEARHQAVILVGLGKKNEWKRSRLRRAAAAAAEQAVKLDPDNIFADVLDAASQKLPHGDCIRHFATALHWAGYRYDKTKSKKAGKAKLRKCVFHAVAADADAARRALHQADATAYAGRLCRDLANLPGNVCTPSYLAAEARKLARTSQKIRLKVLRESDMERLGMGAFLSVSRGSREPGFLICLEYRNAAARQAPVALVGKGITFDTGGTSIKPSSAMDEMKFDMTGAASVLASVAFCARMKLKLNVVGLLACAENMPGGNASKPGDVVTTMSGQTVEILNTDAEGRLVLCDALTYAGRYKPECVVDVATLTGACVVALGHEASGLLSNDQKLADELIGAGETAGDRAWQLPMWDEYQSQLDSNFADIANIGGRGGGTITAACFMSRFTTDYRWAHLDIAGTAWHSGKRKGSSGRPVPLLTQFLLARAERQA